MYKTLRGLSPRRLQTGDKKHIWCNNISVGRTSANDFTGHSSTLRPVPV